MSFGFNMSIGYMLNFRVIYSLNRNSKLKTSGNKYDIISVKTYWLELGYLTFKEYTFLR